MRNLFICVTEFQIFNAINIAHSLLQGEKTDIIITRNNTNSQEIFMRLQKIGVFEKVYFYEEWNNIVLQDQLQKHKGIGLKKFKTWLQFKFNRQLGKLSRNINKNALIGEFIGIIPDYSCYDRVFSLEVHELVTHCLSQLQAQNQRGCEFNLIDEGVGSYLLSRVMATKFPVHHIYLYKPSLAAYYDSPEWQHKLRQIPAVKTDDELLKNKLNTVFSWTESNKLVERIGLFFDQSDNHYWVPSFCQSGLLSRFFKKKLVSNNFFANKMLLLQKCITFLADKNFVIKLHPRGKNSLRQDYLEAGFGVLPYDKVPWEIFCLNNSFKDNIWLTIFSSAAVSYKYVFSNEDKDVKLVFMYRLLAGCLPLEGELETFFIKVEAEYPEEVFIPRTEEELRIILQRKEVGEE